MGALVLFHLADCVVTQTVMNRNSLCRLAPILRTKLRIIRNGVGDTRFSPIAKSGEKVFRFICVGTVSEVKNPVRLVQALRILREQTTQPYAVAEGMASGFPIVVSRVSDLVLIVEAGENGITCNAF